ncbi:MAG TPA: helix-turn-helix domain-containing protein [Candidatus Tectomicrobia bacterium]
MYQCPPLGAPGSSPAPEATLEQLCLPQPLRVVQSGVLPVCSEAAPLDEPARIRQALDQTGGNVVQAARLLRLNRGALRYRMRQHGIGRPSWEALTRPHGSRAQEPSGPFEADRSRCTSVEIRALEPAWEQKPVVVLAIDVMWLEAMEHHALRADPWTLAMRWHQAIAEKVQGFGGCLVQPAPMPLTAVFGLPHTLEQMPQRAVQAALAIRHQLLEDRAADGKQPDLAVRMAAHLGQVLVDIQASDPTARLLALGETLSLPVRPGRGTANHRRRRGPYHAPPGRGGGSGAGRGTLARSVCLGFSPPTCLAPLRGRSALRASPRWGEARSRDLAPRAPSGMFFCRNRLSGNQNRCAILTEYSHLCITIHKYKPPHTGKPHG